MSVKRRKLITHTFRGGRFEDHGLDVDVLPELVRYKGILADLAKNLWHRKHPDRERLPKNFDESLALKFYELRDNCVSIPLERLIVCDDASLFVEPPPDELDEAAELLTRTIEAVASDQAVPEAFPRQLLCKFDDYGKSLRADEFIELTPAASGKLARFDAQVRERLVQRLLAPYQDFVDVQGVVTMARWTNRRMALLLADEQEVDAAFRPEQEETITTALKEHMTARIRIRGRGQFNGSGRLEKIVEVTDVSLLKQGEIAFDATAKPIWESFEEVLAQVPPEELSKLPFDGAENHDYYIHGWPTTSP